ncbi:hypothetical protein RJ639_005416 [Escallonia herrerae]|uniref:Amino acid transporter transmembrane domain-containing protein n=1 Tax=Escallonia herrerae TaxID=1293975 RepID=A0AA88VUF0_9ASTE|nr:hypothetical protein RJ639_005416 [Escallonia herrerae]
MYTVHPVRAELGKPSDMNSAVRISLLLSVTIYFAVGFTGYLLFGDSIMADMLFNFDQNSDSPIVRGINNYRLPSICIPRDIHNKKGKDYGSVGYYPGYSDKLRYHFHHCVQFSSTEVRPNYLTSRPS